MSIRVLESPSVQRAKDRLVLFEQGKLRNKPEPWSGKILGISVVEGIARVDETLMQMQDTRDQGPQPVPLWHLFVLDLGFKDITPADQPPLVPLPGLKPHRQAERERLADLVPARPRTRPLVARPA